ncbi:YqgE/AlgH family protein [Acidihalobacter prosperus]|uniref:UPF0301 protein Thpro_022386 n=1 Tax=Acidihalobacter prosperus TaxID=160660 RepID=A0A1A6C0P7_9GAMM|nr:YqgE/AlgH family protein [Acidihalobacter prosperus]OBS08136.1 protein YqgE [Acidihalobacter prosperus]
MAPIDSLSNHFLIAMPRLEDPNFTRTLTLICEHSEEGAMGVVVNRPLDLGLGELLEHMRIESTDASLQERPVHYGGPVEQERGFVLHRPLGDWGTTIKLTPTLGLTASRDILAAMARDGEPRDAMVLLGYAGWGPGQLEAELTGNAWLTLPAEESILFETATAQRWETAASRLGVDLNLVTGDIGHA